MSDAHKVKFSDILSSKGMEYINRAHFRSHTLNIFKRNTDLLIEALTTLSDPERHIRDLNDENRGDRQQILKDAMWLAHNFLAGAMTLVDHTRVFVKDYYLGTTVNRQFSDMISREFSQNELTKFIQDLRNYMVHRGPLPLERSLQGVPVEGGEPNLMEFTSGFYLRKEDLLKWGGWKSEAKKFLDKQNDDIELLPIVEGYKLLIDDFHARLDHLILEYHREDLGLLEKMQEAFEAERE